MIDLVLGDGKGGLNRNEVEKASDELDVNQNESDGNGI